MPPSTSVPQRQPLAPFPTAPWADAREIATVAAIVTLAVLGILLPIQALRARRRQATIEPLPSTGGLYPDTDPTPDDELPEPTLPPGSDKGRR